MLFVLYILMILSRTAFNRSLSLRFPGGRGGTDSANAVSLLDAPVRIVCGHILRSGLVIPWIYLSGKAP